MPKLVKNLKAEAAKRLLALLIEKLDNLDADDFFGSEGWRHYLSVEDEFGR